MIMNESAGIGKQKMKNISVLDLPVTFFSILTHRKLKKRVSQASTIEEIFFSFRRIAENT